MTLDPNAEDGGVHKSRIELLAPGMIIQEDVRSIDGALLIAKGQEVTQPLIIKLKNLHARRVIGADVTVSTARSTFAFGKSAS